MTFQTMRIIPTIAELEAANLPRVRFKPSNGAGYFMDHSFWRTMPAHLEFYVCPFPGGHKETQVELLAPGYGVSEDYGNGSIFISKDEVEKWRA